METQVMIEEINGIVSGPATTAKKRGRPRKTPAEVSAPVEPPKKRGRPRKTPVEPEVAQAAAEPPKKQDTAQTTARELEAAVSTAGGWWSAEADAARCERAIHASKHWIDVAAFAVVQGETAARALARSRAVAQGHSPHAVDDHLARVPWMREVPLRYAGRDANCEEVNAQAIAFIAGYFLPATPDHPLAQAGIALAASFVAYQRAIRAALEVPREP
jgi:hypothetical protein